MGKGYRMKTTGVIVLVIVAAIFLATNMSKLPIKNEPHTFFLQTNKAKETAVNFKENLTAIPTKIIIEGHESPIFPVGLTEDGAMDTIDDAESIAWYQYGSIPGEEGNTLLAGHKDWDGSLGAFYKLENLKPGTEIVVELSNSEKKTLILERTEIYDMDQVPIDIMKIDGEERTTLITCSGDFVKERGGYEDRVISIFKDKEE